MLTRQIRVMGRVQGVGFRYALRSEAVKLGVTGWVRNRADGSVEALLQGSQETVNRLIDWARRGPGAAAVSGVVDEAPAPQEQRAYSGFELRPTV